MSRYHRVNGSYTKSKEDRNHGSSDLRRCAEVGRRVLKALEAGAERAVVYGKPRKERVEAVRTSRVE